MGKSLRELRTAGDVIDALGGGRQLALMVGRTEQAVSNWRAAGQLAPFTYEILKAALAERGYRASCLLWGIRPVPKKARSRAA